MKYDISNIDSSLLQPEAEDTRYINSPFRHLKKLLPKQKGTRYEKITENIMKSVGSKVNKAESKQHDRIIDDKKVEIKGSMLNAGTNNFSFLQIRPDQDYDSIYFVMLYPNQVVIMEMNKEEINKNIETEIFKKQHGGKKAESRTFMYYGNRETLTALGAKVIIE